MSDKRVIIYCRESRDERGENYERIETQRDILINYCNKNRLGRIVDIIMDDDVSGTSFKRFESVLEMAKKRLFDVILFKDSSRLGRNLKESINFTDEIKRLGIEVVFESEDYNEDFFPLLAWFNEQRAKEDSKKIRRVLRHKMETGELVIRPAFGYKKDKDGCLSPDTVYSKTVKDIFKMFCDGKTTSQIAEKLNREKIPTPSQSKLLSNACEYWNSQHIRRILSDSVYIGTMTYLKRTTISFKDRRAVINPQNEWIVIKNHHESIVDSETFDRVSKMLGRRNILRKNPSKKEHCLSGIMFCGKCGSRLIFRETKNSKDYYICAKNNREGSFRDYGRGCFTHRCCEQDILSEVLELIKDVLYRNIDFLQKNCNLSSKKRDIIVKRNSIKLITEQIYTDKLNGIIDEELFLKKYSYYKQLQAQYEDKLSRLKEEDISIESIINSLSLKQISGDILRLFLDEGISFLPNEFSEKTLNSDLSCENEYNLDKYGGILLNLKFKIKPQSKFADRWL